MRKGMYRYSLAARCEGQDIKAFRELAAHHRRQHPGGYIRRLLSRKVSLKKEPRAGSSGLPPLFTAYGVLPGKLEEFSETNINDEICSALRRVDSTFKGRQSASPPGVSHYSFSYPWDWWDSVISAPRYPWDWRGLHQISSKYLWEWRDSDLSCPKVPLVLARLRQFSPQIPLGLSALSHFTPRYPWDRRRSVISPPGTLGAGSSKMTCTGESLTEFRGLGFTILDISQDRFEWEIKKIHQKTCFLFVWPFGSVLAKVQSFQPPGTLRTDAWDWRDSVISAPRYPGEWSCNMTDNGE